MLPDFTLTFAEMNLTIRKHIVDEVKQKLKNVKRGRTNMRQGTKINFLWAHTGERRKIQSENAWICNETQHYGFHFLFGIYIYFGCRYKARGYNNVCAELYHKILLEQCQSSSEPALNLTSLCVAVTGWRGTVAFRL